MSAVNNAIFRDEPAWMNPSPADEEQEFRREMEVDHDVLVLKQARELFIAVRMILGTLPKPYNTEPHIIGPEDLLAGTNGLINDIDESISALQGDAA